MVSSRLHRKSIGSRSVSNKSSARDTQRRAAGLPARRLDGCYDDAVMMALRIGVAA